MRPAVAIEELNKLRAEAQASGEFVKKAGLESWKARVRLVLVGALGPTNNIVEKFDTVSYGVMVAWSGMPESIFENAVRSGVHHAVELIEAAIYELGLAVDHMPVDDHAYDADLWAHVKTEVQSGQWGKVASQTAIFVESRIRTWTGTPKDAKGNNLVGKQLYAEALNESSPYSLGRQASEREGWRALAVGFAQALSNVDRHQIQVRSDAKRYGARCARAWQPLVDAAPPRARGHLEKSMTWPKFD